MTQQADHQSFINRTLTLYLGDWKTQWAIYSTTFLIAMGAALIADLGLGQSEVVVTILTVGLVIILSFLVPAIPAWRFGEATKQQTSRTVTQHVIAVEKRLTELAERVEVLSQPYEVLMDEGMARELAGLVRTSSSPSLIHYIQDLVYTSWWLEPKYARRQGQPTITLPADLKSLLDQLALVNGFASGAEYLANALEMRIKAMRNREEENKRLSEEKWKKIQGSQYIPTEPFPGQSASEERWPLNLEREIKLKIM